MPRKLNMTTPQSASKKQSKKLLQRQRTQFGELDTTPTSWHEESPIPSARPKRRVNGSGAKNTDRTTAPDEFEDGIDDCDLEKFADTQPNTNPQVDRKIAWSEKDSETHRSSSMYSHEEQHSGEVFGYIGEDDPFSSPVSGHDALPDTLPLPNVYGDLSVADGHGRSPPRVDFSETASTVYRSSPFGRSHASKKSGTTSRPPSIYEEAEGINNPDKPNEPKQRASNRGVLLTHVDGQQPISQMESTAKDTSNQKSSDMQATLPSAPLPPCDDSIGAESGKTGCTLRSEALQFDNALTDLLQETGERGTESNTQSCDLKPKKKRKQRPKTPIQFDEETQEVISMPRRPVHNKPQRKPLTRGNSNPIGAVERGHKKRKVDNTSDDNPRKRFKLAEAIIEQDLTLDDGTGTAYSTTESSLVSNQSVEQRLHDSEVTSLSEEQIQVRRQSVHDNVPPTSHAEVANRVHSPEPAPAVSCLRPPVLSKTHDVPKYGDCIVVAQDLTENDMHFDTDGDLFSHIPSQTHEVACGVGGADNREGVAITSDQDKDTELAAENSGILGRAIEELSVEMPQTRVWSRSRRSNLADTRVGGSFSVSERGSPIPWQQQEKMVDMASTKGSSVASSDMNVSKINYDSVVAQKCTRAARGTQTEIHQPDRQIPADNEAELPQTTLVVQVGNHRQAQESAISDIARNPRKCHTIKAGVPLVQTPTAFSEARQQLHELVDAFIRRVDSKVEEIWAVKDGYKSAGNRCVEKIHARFLRERYTALDVATDHTKRFQSLVSKGVKSVDQNSKKRSESLQDLIQTTSHQRLRYEHAMSTLSSLYEQLIANRPGDVLQPDYL